jgi:lipid A 3-O-deacylase
MMAAQPAAADINSVHVGVLVHNICVTDCKNADKEDGPAVEFQVNWDSPELLNWALSPEPYAVASLNVAGETSFVGVGLEWHWEFADGWALSPGLGYVIHNGEKESPYPQGSAESAAFSEEHVLLGSRDLFRTSLGLSRDFGERWEAELFFSHLSHGQIIGSGHNQGLDQAGVRIGYSFGG